MAHSSLLAGDWSLARSYLEDLSRRTDVRDTLPRASSYGVPECIERLIQDRIDAVNSAVERARLASQ